MESVLLLNVDYTPLEVISWRRAIELLYREAVVRVEAYAGRFLHSASEAMPFPAVVRLVDRYARRKVRRSRKNVIARDGYTCQYCGAQPRKKSGSPKLSELTIDHVVPQAQAVNGWVTLPWRSGQRVRTSAWENVLTACAPCNTFKADRTPTEAGMQMRKVPKAPTPYEIAWMSLFQIRIPEEWKDYLPRDSPWRDYWDVELED